MFVAISGMSGGISDLYLVDVRLPGPSANEMFAISPDNRTIYYGATHAEADIWIVERK